jgi:hypothetical protein
MNIVLIQQWCRLTLYMLVFFPSTLLFDFSYALMQMLYPHDAGAIHPTVQIQHPQTHPTHTHIARKSPMRQIIYIQIAVY